MTLLQQSVERLRCAA